MAAVVQITGVQAYAGTPDPLPAKVIVTGVSVESVYNHPPTVSLTPSVLSIYPGQTAQIVATAADEDGTITSYDWSTSLGTIIGTGPIVELYCPPRITVGVATITCMVTDNGGATATAHTTVTLQRSSWKRADGTPLILRRV
jgi:hypothetical protein